MLKNLSNRTNVVICSNRIVLEANVPKNCTLHVIQQNQFAKKTHPVHSSANITSSKSNGLSNARNEAIDLGKQHAFKEICFTDDDCILDQSWSFYFRNWKNEHPHSEIVFGKTLPYQPDLHKSEFCPCTFTKRSNKTPTLSSKHWEEVGLGNNMTIDMEVFDKLGKFKPWLGAGSIGLSGEDAEFILRCQIAGIPIDYNPNLIVYHNKWQNEHNFRQQHWMYTCGGLAAYGFYAFQGVKECQPTVLFYLQESWFNIRHDFSILIWSPWKIFKILFPDLTERISPNTSRDADSVEYVVKKFLFHLTAPIMEISMVMRGLLLAFLYSKIIPIPDKENVVKRYYKSSK